MVQSESLVGAMEIEVHGAYFFKKNSKSVRTDSYIKVLWHYLNELESKQLYQN